MLLLPYYTNYFILFVIKNIDNKKTLFVAKIWFFLKNVLSKYLEVVIVLTKEENCLRYEKSNQTRIKNLAIEIITLGLTY
jgi:hypothetical protein